MTTAARGKDVGARTGFAMGCGESVVTLPISPRVPDISRLNYGGHRTSKQEMLSCCGNCVQRNSVC